jgi:hypothetical protein
VTGAEAIEFFLSEDARLHLWKIMSEEIKLVRTYDRCIYNYNSGVVVPRPELFCKVEENLFVFKFHSVCNL